VPSHRPIDWIEQKELEKKAGSHVFFSVPLQLLVLQLFIIFLMDLHFYLFFISHFPPQCADPSAPQYRATFSRLFLSIGVSETPPTIPKFSQIKTHRNPPIPKAIEDIPPVSCVRMIVACPPSFQATF